MKVWTLNELFRLTRNELVALHRRVVADLVPLPLDHPDRELALGNLRNIRRALARSENTPR